MKQWLVLQDPDKKRFATKSEAAARASELHPEDDSYQRNARIFYIMVRDYDPLADEEKIQAWIRGEIEL